MKNNLVTNILLIVIAILLILNLIPKKSPNSNRYSMSVQSDRIIKLDKETGEIWGLSVTPMVSWQYKLGTVDWEYTPADYSHYDKVDSTKNLSYQEKLKTLQELQETNRRLKEQLRQKQKP